MSRSASELVQSLLDLSGDTRSGMLQAAFHTHRGRSALALELVEELVTRLEREELQADPERYANVADILNRTMPLVPTARFNSGAARDRVGALLERSVKLPGPVEHVVPVRLMVDLREGDPRDCLRVLCGLAAQGAERSAALTQIAVWALRRRLTGKSMYVGEILALLDEIERAHGTAVAPYVEKLERAAGIRGLRSVFGASLRASYARVFVRSRLLEDDTSVLIVGPSGTSKTFMAELIAANSSYSRVCKLDCAGDKDDTLSKLRNVANGAKTEPTTVIYDEVYKSPLELQEASLVTLDDASGIRAISTSSTSAEKLRGILKEDFYNRISGWTYRLEGLSEDRDDLREVLVRTAHAEGVEFDTPVLDWLVEKHDWPGNHREVRDRVREICGCCRQADSHYVDVQLLRTHREDLSDVLIGILGDLIGDE